MGDTDDTSIYRDTKISRYWYRVCLDTFWYRDTKVSRYFFDTFGDTTHAAKLLIRYFRNFVTLIDISTAGIYDIGDIAVAVVGLTLIVKLGGL